MKNKYVHGPFWPTYTHGITNSACIPNGTRVFAQQQVADPTVAGVGHLLLCPLMRHRQRADSLAENENQAISRWMSRW